ncbi:DM13 domain-containing protein [Neptuniibacter sp.]|uniref:DM13 domain-containing protein n=1 Tax=Neptuniibacter sp. TaxID=1962643 RepID=UPI0026238270|nr:DM13 domain-containing protein [Neptuniibacter sp.]MCP4597347.1 DM13 domain-containing protein [Neptuniibacter sp.]
MRKLFLLGSHAAVGFIGFALGIYLLPILIEEEPATVQAVTSAKQASSFQAQFKKELKGSDSLHWGEGTVSLGSQLIAFEGELAPGPDYKLYLSPSFVEDEETFLQAKSQMVRVADIKSFGNFVVPVPAGVEINNYNSVIIWCETFSEFITAGRYQ